MDSSITITLRQTDDGCFSITSGTVLPYFELRFNPVDWHLEADYLLEHVFIIIRRQLMQIPWPRTVAFVFSNQILENGSGAMTVLHCPGAAIRMHDGIIPGGNGRLVAIPVGRNVSMRAPENGERTRRSIELPPVFVGAGYVTQQDCTIA